jgi:pimeloyl-ACP methyl ester carboxylesterase
VAVTPLAFRRDSLGEAGVLPQTARGPSAVLALLRTGLADSPEERVAGLTVPLLLTAGRQDSYAPASWLAALASAARSSPAVTARRISGSHNNLFTHPQEVATLVAGWRRSGLAGGLHDADGPQ